MLRKLRQDSETGKLLQRGNRARDRGEWQAAVDAYQGYLCSAPQDHAIWVQLGNCAKEAGDYRLSFSAYEQALILDDTLADIHLQLGHLCKCVGRIGHAINHYQNALNLDPSFVDAERELEAIKGSLDQKPFLLISTYLDLITAQTPEELLNLCRNADPSEDPFQKFSNIVK